MTNAGFSDATTVASHDSASTSITPPADSRLASKKACVDRSSRQSRSPRRRRRREDAIGVGRLFDATLPLACHTPLDDGYGQPSTKRYDRCEPAAEVTLQVVTTTCRALWRCSSAMGPAQALLVSYFANASWH